MEPAKPSSTPETTPNNQPQTSIGAEPVVPVHLDSLVEAKTEPVQPTLNAYRRSWSHINLRSKRGAALASFGLAVVVILAVIFFVGQVTKKPTPSNAAINGRPLSVAELNQLSANSLSYDQSGQTLAFHSPVVLDKGLQVNGSSTLSALTTTGTLNTDSIAAKQNLQITGATLLQGTVTAKGLLTADNLIINGNSTVTGNANFNGNGSFAGSLSASSLSVKTANIGGLSFGHIVTTGAAPSAVPNNGAGGGSVTISGNDTSGTVTITTGPVTPAQGDLVTIVFRTPFSSTPHAVVTPLGISTATAIANPTGNPANGGGQVYVSNSTTQMTIGVSKLWSGVAGITYTFNYFVSQ